ncbi:DUF7336 domain-containing protein [Lentzea flava]|uniref:DUF7336 domain-containing protein n=1 Tax=Lentzea flava TaxID=103732 RepID=A0ABQ2UA76_9PSEU|nr:hypothetical protein [Lentzea flava]MCP2196691.1 hypothetical protein [Lentzea flava]GGU16208.1 hypothetical protein GCM10010178_04810 [Lentzea flava]
MSDRVFLLWHVHHVATDSSGAVRHFDPGGEFRADEEEGDDVKMLGVYSSRENAMARIERAKELPGFRDEPECFYIGEYTLDEDQWTTGFTAV